MKRRGFIRASFGMAAQAAVIPTCLLATKDAALFPLPAQQSRKIEYLEDVSLNYRAWRETLIEKVAKQGYTFHSASLERPVGGFRRATVHVTDETGIAKTLIWFQPWRGDCVDQ